MQIRAVRWAKRNWLVAMLLFVAGCPSRPHGHDGGTPDAGTADAGVGDGGAADAGPACDPNGTLDGGPAPEAGPLTVVPDSAQLGTGLAMRFSAGGPAGWAVVEGAAGGSIDADGDYIAPATPGSYHVSATRGGVTVTATVVVHEARMDVVAGAFGGAGVVDGPAAEARFWSPRALVRAADGTLLVGDGGNEYYQWGLVRTVAVDGTVTSSVGRAGFGGSVDGVGMAARLDTWPQLAPGGAGRLFAADSSSLRSIDLPSATATSIVPPAGASFGGIRALAFDGDHTLYLADSAGVRALDVGSGTVAAFAAAADSGLLVFDSGRLSSLRAGQVVGWDLPGGARQVLSVAGLDACAAIGDGPGALLLVDRASQRLARLDLADGSIATVAALDGLSGACGLVAEDAGHVLLTREGRPTIDRVERATGLVTLAYGQGGPTQVAGSATFAKVQSLAAVGNGLFVADDQAVRRVDLDTLAVAPAAAVASAYLASDGTRLYIEDGGRGGVSSLVPGAMAAPLGPMPALDDGPGCMYACDDYYWMDLAFESGALYGGTGTRFQSALARMNPSCGGSAVLAAPIDLGRFTGDHHGHLFVLDQHFRQAIDVIDTRTMALTMTSLAPTGEPRDGPVAQASLGASARPLSADAAGRVYVCDWVANAVRRFDPATQTVTTPVGVLGRPGAVPGTLPAGLTAPSAIWATLDGKVYVASEQALFVVR